MEYDNIDQLSMDHTLPNIKQYQFEPKFKDQIRDKIYLQDSESPEKRNNELYDRQSRCSTAKTTVQIRRQECKNIEEFKYPEQEDQNMQQSEWDDRSFQIIKIQSQFKQQKKIEYTLADDINFLNQLQNNILKYQLQVALRKRLI